MISKPTIFITGAASGIGRQTALLFAKRNWFAGIFDLNEGGLLSLQAEVGETNCCTETMDVANPASVKAAVHSFAEATGGRMDVLFNNAGIAKMGPNEYITLEDQHLTVDINFKGILSCIHASLPHLKQTPGSRIISMCSASAIYGIPELAVYSATKHAVKALTEALEIELGKYGITVSDILVPYVRTPLITDAATKAFSVERMGVRVEAVEVAETVWRAAHSRRLHWHMTARLNLLRVLFWAFPFAKRNLIKSLAAPPEVSPR
ncbi:MAG: SDR family oxidoreductase [Candidatus Abyssobacteria bacterium SURF_5]|uniref:SDR family oxidoreductase n=1 Tax=Abyssobacteria bacterium (strain SURF_5) TaxID=2093360 RepID=A0A3A4P4G0_ABYX5|nr:MAG: SDR family oxidoreductase [Candidatus Abyssubacteria bacterium SURF_5]